MTKIIRNSAAALSLAAALALATGACTASTAPPSSITPPSIARTASYITTRDGVQLYYKDWGPRNGAVVTFSHGWPLISDSWESQML